MSNITSIQWCHTTVNPVSGCDGCPLWPGLADLEIRITNLVMAHAPNANRNAVREHVRLAMQCPDSNRRITQAQVALEKTLEKYAPQLTKAALELAWRELKQVFRCYAGVLCHRFQGHSPAYPETFDIAQRFPGRMEKAATYGFPTAHEIQYIPAKKGKDGKKNKKATPAKPWLQGLRRLIFVSDMGDALSDNIDFSYAQCFGRETHWRMGQNRTQFGGPVSDLTRN